MGWKSQGSTGKETHSDSKLPSLISALRVSASQLLTNQLHGPHDIHGSSQAHFTQPSCCRELSPSSWKVLQSSHCPWCRSQNSFLFLTTAFWTAQSLSLLPQLLAQQCRKAPWETELGCALKHLSMRVAGLRLTAVPVLRSPGLHLLYAQVPCIARHSSPIAPMCPPHLRDLGDGQKVVITHLGVLPVQRETRNPSPEPSPCLCLVEVEVEQIHFEREMGLSTWPRQVLDLLLQKSIWVRGTGRFLQQTQKKCTFKE